MKRFAIIALSIVFTLLILTQTALAIPAFARSTASTATCAMWPSPSSTTSPALPDNGYQIPARRAWKRRCSRPGFPFASGRRPDTPFMATAKAPRPVSISTAWISSPRAFSTRTFRSCSSIRRGSTSRRPISAAPATASTRPAGGHRIRQRGLQQHRPGEAQTCASAASSRAFSS